MIEIDESHFLGEGATRRVYLHPDDSTKIIKVFHPDNTPEIIRNSTWYGRFAPRGRYDANQRDMVENTKFRERHNFLKPNICEIFEYAETNLGPAIIVERIMNEDGQTSHTLPEHIRNGRPESLIEPLTALYKTFADHHVLLRDESPRNILVRRTKTGLELVIVDGLGDSNVIKYATASKFLNRMKLERKLKRLLGKLDRVAEKTKARAKKQISQQS